jgi:plastocyanin
MDVRESSLLPRSKGALFGASHQFALGVVVVLAVAGTWATLASGSASKASKTITVLAKDNGVTMSPNKYIQDNMAFSPGTVTVKSGDSITFRFDKPNSHEPHTMTIVNQKDLPTNGMQVENCHACQQLASPHLKKPKAEPGPGNPIVHWTLNKGNPGFDTVGDSIAIEEPGAHKNNTVKVTAKPGTTLYFLCAVHPWMQGKMVVK